MSCLALLGAGVIAAPAAMATGNTVNVTISCTGPVYAPVSAGDTIVFTFGPACTYDGTNFPNQYWELENLNGILPTFSAYGFLDHSSYTGNIGYYGPSPGSPGYWGAYSAGVADTVTVTVNATDGISTPLQTGSILAEIDNQYEDPSPAVPQTYPVINGVAPGTDGAPTAPMQGYVRTQGSHCADNAPQWVNWPGIAAAQYSGWGESWAQWPNKGTGGFVCERQPYYTSAGTWAVQ